MVIGVYVWDHDDPYYKLYNKLVYEVPGGMNTIKLGDIIKDPGMCSYLLLKF